MARPSLVSFISPVCNQGDEARLTVASAKAAFGSIPHEIILVDDHSLDGSCHGLPKDVLVVRTPRREGVSAARRCGYEQALGDVLVWSDPHCRFPVGSLERLSTLAAEQRAIFQPKIAPTENARVRCGGSLTVSERGLRVQREFRRPHLHPALYGTVYAMRRDVYDYLGGWPRLPGVWSYSEQALTLMAWFLNIPVVVDLVYTCIHKSYHVDKKFPFSVSNDDIASNAHFVHAAFFPQTYPFYWRMLLDRHFGKQIDVDALLASRSLARLRRHISRHRVRSESAFFSDYLKISEPSATIADTLGQNIVYRKKMPNGEAYVRQQAERSKPKEYLGMRPRVDAALAWMASQLPSGVLPTFDAMDAGTRDGYGTLALQGLRARSVIGIELVSESADYAKQLGRPVIQGDMMSLSYPQQSFDLITCIHALEHVPHPLTAVKEFARVLRKDGWMYIVVPLDIEQQPENDSVHNCSFSSVEQLCFLANETGLFDLKTVQSSIGMLARGRREIRFLIRRTGS